MFSLSKVLGPRSKDNDNELSGPTYTFCAHPEFHVQSMASTENFLLTGSMGEICGWDWKVILSDKASKAKPTWTVQIPCDKYVSYSGKNIYRKVSQKLHLDIFRDFPIFSEFLS